MFYFRYCITFTGPLEVKHELLAGVGSLKGTLDSKLIPDHKSQTESLVSKCESQI